LKSFGTGKTVLQGKRVLLVIGGGIAAYKCLELIRRIRERGGAVRCIMTRAAGEFVTPLSVAALSGDKVYGELFSLTDEHEMGHIQLSRSADLLVVAPATANLLARMAAGIADDLATTALLATDKPVVAVPAMNVRMWQHPATQDNVAKLIARGVRIVGPDDGDMACGEYGPGRMAEPHAILAAIEAHFASGALAGRRALVTSGPTFEAIDPVRYIANRSSGKQGHAIAGALARLGAATTLVTGPTHEADPAGVTVVRIESAREMLDACRKALPVDVAVCAAAVADWRPADAKAEKIKKDGGAAPAIALAENPDILKALSGAGNFRPRLVIGFAAETGDVVAKAEPKRRAKGCDWLVANDVATGTGTFGGDDNTVHLITAEGTEDWPRMTKRAVAERLAGRIAAALSAAPGAV
jgi:phosphopantothenoylcysteine decarboxylase/phosphopantothenate--cysteine ligase